MNKQIEFAKLNHIKIDNEILRDRVGEVLETFFLNKDAGTDIEEITSLLYNYDVMKETEIERLKTFLERIGKSLNVPKKKNNRSKRK